MRKTGTLLLCTVAASFALSGCIPALVTAGATTGGVVAAQDRSAGNAVDDAGIKLTIDNLYLNKDINDLFKNVHVHVSEGRVLLTGAVQKEETKESAAQLAWKASGVREVINEIQVGDNGIVDYARDTWISAQIRSRILFEKDVRSVNYNIETVNGVVYLLGIAQNQDELNKVTYIASTTKYVKQVVSHVIMTNDPRRGAFIKHDDNRSQSSTSGGQQSSPGGQSDSYRDTPGGVPNNGADSDNGGSGQPETRSHMQSQPQ